MKSESQSQRGILIKCLVIGDECVGKSSLVSGLLASSIGWHTSAAASASHASRQKRESILSLSNQYGRYSTKYVPTMGVDISWKSFASPVKSFITSEQTTNQVTCNMLLYEVGGRPIYSPLVQDMAKHIKSSLKVGQADSEGSRVIHLPCIVAVYDVSRESSLASVTSLLDSLNGVLAGQGGCCTLSDPLLASYIRNGSTASAGDDPPVIGLLLGNKSDTTLDLRHVTHDMGSHVARRYKLRHAEVSARTSSNVTEPFQSLVAELTSLHGNIHATRERHRTDSSDPATLRQL